MSLVRFLREFFSGARRTNAPSVPIEANDAASRPNLAVLQARFPSARSPMSWVMGICILFSVVLITTASVAVFATRNRTIAEESNNLARLSLALATHTHKIIFDAHLIISDVEERILATVNRTAHELEQLAESKLTNDSLRDMIAVSSDLDTLAIVDKSGKMINSSSSWPPPAINVSDRDYFIALRANPDLDYFISMPLKNRVTGQDAIFMARRISDPGGAFVGVIVGSVATSRFEKLFGPMLPSERSSISLYRRDGSLLSRLPQFQSLAEKSHAVQQLLAETISGSEQRVLRTHVFSPGGRLQIVALQTVRGYPLVVAVANTEDVVLSSWRQLAALISVVTTSAILLLVIGGYLVGRQFKMQMQVDQARADQERSDQARQIAEAAERIQMSARQELKSIMDHASDALISINESGIVLNFSKPAERIFGYGAGEVIGSDVNILLVEPIRLGLDEQTAAGLGTNQLRMNESQRDLQGRRKDGSIFPIEMFVAQIAQEAGFGRYVVTVRDITERRKAEADIAHMAHHDALTGLANRLLLNERLEMALLSIKRNESVAVLFLDLDHFKGVNDTFGHSTGDELLKEIASRLSGVTRTMDIVARLGGDEFVVVLTGVERPTDAEFLARRIREAITVPLSVGGQQIFTDVSIGIAVAPNDGMTSEQLLKNADMALYGVKADGRGTYRFFEPEMDARVKARRALESDLRNALTNGEMELHYQPLVNIACNAIVGCEALLRWKHPGRGMVSPAEFIPVAEETGLIVSIGKWVLDTACAEAKAWPDDIKIAVNVSPVQFKSKGLALTIAGALAASGLPARRLEIEITEAVMMQNNEATQSILRQIHDLGVRIAMDDFGTGYSSLGYLRSFPFNKIKIDRSFVADLLGHPEAVSIVRSIAILARELNMITTAEGVETQEQLDIVRELGCTEMQGHLISRPVSAAEVLRLLERPVVSSRETDAA